MNDQLSKPVGGSVLSSASQRVNGAGAGLPPAALEPPQRAPQARPGRALETPPRRTPEPETPDSQLAGPGAPGEEADLAFSPIEFSLLNGTGSDGFEGWTGAMEATSGFDFPPP